MEKDNSKGKIALFVIGILVGAVISTTAFLICVNVFNVGPNSGQSSQMQQGGTPPEMQSGQSDQNSQGGTPPEKPSDDNSQKN
ncbi:hypothetical protein IKG13_02135 [Candidatus Saccharibacteria bacterium]|nr:hypothetical protein [Candidatus Saccharibacteria bacterium]